eukprot:g27919.t1
MGGKEIGYVQGGSAERGNRSVAPCSEVLKAGELGRNARQGMLTRQQWKNKMKNKHRNKNKFRPTVTSSAENGGQMKVKAECERILKKSEPEQDEGTNITDRHKTKIKQKKGRSQEGTDPAERTVSEINNEKISNLNQRTRNHNQNSETLSKRRKRMCEQQRDCISGSPSPLARDLALPVGINGTKSGPPSPTSNRSAALRNKMEERLKSARFRYINEQLYTSSSADAMKLFAQDLATFQLYHRGFTAQVERWPENPVDRIIQYIRNRYSWAEQGVRGLAV